MANNHEEVGIGSFAVAFGDLESKPEDIPEFDALWRSVSPGTEFAAMGCATYRTMSGPAEDYVVDAVRRSLRDADVAATDVDHIVLATSDPTVALLPDDFGVRVIHALGLGDCVPHLLSFQRCCSSLGALPYGNQLFTDPDVANVLVVGLDFTPDDRKRIRDYAVFGDAAASCLLTRHDPGLVRLLSSAIRVDEDGLRGEDSILSRKQVADIGLSSALRAGGRELKQIDKVFPANLHQPLTLFNATAAGFDLDKLHYAEMLAAYGHCGNCDWMINIADYHDRVGVVAGATYLAYASAQGFYACGLFEGSPRPGAEA